MMLHFVKVTSLRGPLPRKQIPCLRSMYNKSKQQFSLFYETLNVIIVGRVIDEYSEGDNDS